MANDMLAEALTKGEQLRRQRKMKELREQELQRKVDVRRNIMIGELVCKYFPAMLELQPHRSRAESEAEFAAFENVLRWLAGHTGLIRDVHNRG